MNFFEDRKIKKIAKKEEIKAPDKYFKSIEETLNDIKNKEEQIRKVTSSHIKKPIWHHKLAFAITMVLFIVLVLPNVNSKIAYAMQEIPVLGEIIKVITIKNYFDKDGNSELDADIPMIKNSDHSQSESNENINEDVNRLTQKIMDNFYQEKDPENHMSVEIKTDLVENSNHWFTLRLTISRTAGSSDLQYKYYHIDKTTDKIVKLADLFANEEYKNVISKEIKRQMIERMQKDDNLIYWFDEEEKEWSFRRIVDDQNFYFSKDDNIVIVFDKYEVGPGSSGAPEFEIPKELYSEYLKK